jgi:tetratricopeptide (TPR) repeat protein
LGQHSESNRAFQEAVRLKPKIFGDLWAAGDYCAYRGRFADANAYFSEDVARYPDHDATAMRSAFLSWALGDHDAYKSMCKHMLEQFGSGKEVAAARRTCLASFLSPHPIGDLKQLVRLADIAAADSFDEVLNYRERGLAAYRAGDWGGALKWSAKSRDLASLPSHRAENLLVEAMALHQLERTSEARSAYDEAVQIAEDYFPGAPRRLRPEWVDWIMLDQLQSEATQLLGLDERQSKGDQTVKSTSGH